MGVGGLVEFCVMDGKFKNVQNFRLLTSNMVKMMYIKKLVFACFLK